MLQTTAYHHFQVMSFSIKDIYTNMPLLIKYYTAWQFSPPQLENIHLSKNKRAKYGLKWQTMTNFRNNFMESGIDFIPIDQLFIFPDI